MRDAATDRTAKDCDRMCASRARAAPADLRRALNEVRSVICAKVVMRARAV
jgi:hypothetical protein